MPGLCAHAPFHHGHRTSIVRRNSTNTTAKLLVVGSVFVLHVQLSFCLAADASAHAVSLDESASTANAVLASWTKRTQQTLTFDIEVTGTRTLVADLLALSTDGRSPVDRIVSLDDLPESASYPVRFRFAKNEKEFLRLESRTQIWSAQRSELIDKESVHVFGHAGRKGLYSKSAFEFPVGHITTRDPASIGRRAVLLPVRLVYLPVHEQIGSHYGCTLAPLAERATISGYHCIGVRSESRYSDEIWVAPELDHLPLQLSRYVSGTLMRVIELEYKTDSNHAPQLAGWSDTALDATGRIVDRSVMRCNNLEINKPLEETLFDIQFPPET